MEPAKGLKSSAVLQFAWFCSWCFHCLMEGKELLFAQWREGLLLFLWRENSSDGKPHETSFIWSHWPVRRTRSVKRDVRGLTPWTNLTQFLQTQNMNEQSQEFANVPIKFEPFWIRLSLILRLRTKTLSYKSPSIWASRLARDMLSVVVAEYLDLPFSH